MLSLKLNKEKHEEEQKMLKEARAKLIFNWNKLNELFYAKYPDGKIWRHGKVAQCDVAVRFSENGKVYNYRGTYYMIAVKLGLVEED